MDLTAEEKKALLRIAWNAVQAAAYDRPPSPIAEIPPSLSRVAHRGAFVTLHQGSHLRGCVGLIESPWSLIETVGRMAVAAAAHDDRFQPVRPHELNRLSLEISILSPLRRLDSAQEIHLGQDGVLVKQGSHSGVFLPQVAEETGWDLETFLGELCAGKAGLPADAWKNPATELYAFTVDLIRE